MTASTDHNVQMKIIAAVGLESVVNTLFFRYSGIAADHTAVVEAINDHWDTEIEDTWLAYLPLSYGLLRLEFMVWGLGWEQYTFTPITYTKTGVGAGTSNLLMGTAPAATIAFSISPTSMLVPDGHNILRRSYIAYGPMQEGFVDNDNQLNTTNWPLASRVALCDALLGAVAVSLAECVPVRWGAEVAGDGKHTVANIAAAQVRPTVTFRRSRLNSR